MSCSANCDCGRVSTPEQHLMAALDGMPELAEALAELRQWVAGEVEVPDSLNERAYLLGIGYSRATELLKIIDRAAGQ